jgi:hypothetical protein
MVIVLGHVLHTYVDTDAQAHGYPLQADMYCHCDDMYPHHLVSIPSPQYDSGRLHAGSEFLSLGLKQYVYQCLVYVCGGGGGVNKPLTLAKRTQITFLQSERRTARIDEWWTRAAVSLAEK